MRYVLDNFTYIVEIEIAFFKLWLLVELFSCQITLALWPIKWFATWNSSKLCLQQIQLSWKKCQNHLKFSLIRRSRSISTKMGYHSRVYQHGFVKWSSFCWNSLIFCYTSKFSLLTPTFYIIVLSKSLILRYCT